MIVMFMLCTLTYLTRIQIVIICIKSSYHSLISHSLGGSVMSFHDASFEDTREKNEAFGSSLLLANSPMSPKIVNGSYAAIIDSDEFLAKAYAGIRIAVSPLKSLNRLKKAFMTSFRITTRLQCGDESGEF